MPGAWLSLAAIRGTRKRAGRQRNRETRAEQIQTALRGEHLHVTVTVATAGEPDEFGDRRAGGRVDSYYGLEARGGVSECSAVTWRIRRDLRFRFFCRLIVR